MIQWNMKRTNAQTTALHCTLVHAKALVILKKPFVINTSCELCPLHKIIKLMNVLQFTEIVIGQCVFRISFQIVINCVQSKKVIELNVF